MLNEEDFGSDTDDDDYVPEGDGLGHDASEEENSGDEEDTAGEDGVAKKKNTKKKKEKSKVVNHRLGLFAENEEKTDWNKELQEEKKEAEEMKEKEKLNSLWSDFKADVGAKPKTTKPKSTGGLGALFSVCNDPTPPAIAKQETKPKNLLSSLFDTNTDSKDKSEEKTEKLQDKPKAKSLLSGLFDEEPSNDKLESKEDDGESKSSKIEITKVFDFAGEEVKITKHVDADSNEAQKYLKQQDEASKTNAATKRPGGLASVVGQFAKKQKMGCLDKSKLDWNSFVKEEGIDEELKTHNKGKDGFVEKQMFLERADLRQFEVEKSMREKVRRQNQ